MKKTIFLTLLAIFLAAGCTSKQVAAPVDIGLDAARVKAVQFINENMMQANSQVSVKEATDDGALYKIVVNLPGGQEVPTYLTKDGKKFIQQVMDIAEVEQQTRARQANSQAAGNQAAAVASKNDKPEVELFVMSHCPYGTQIEKGILPVLSTLGDKINFTLKFCDYAMHQKPEIDEQLNQYCIQKEYPDKLLAYLECFLANQNKSAECMQQNNISQAGVKNCIAATDAEFGITDSYNDRSTWSNGSYPPFAIYAADAEKYGVSGSPSLVINGVKIQSGRDSASLLKTICSAFNEEPEECATELSATTPAPGFGYGGSGTDTAAGCGS